MSLIKKTFALIAFSVFCLSVHQTTAQVTTAAVNESRIKSNDLYMVNKVSIYPNPTTDFVNLTISNSNLKNPSIEVYNILGNLMKVEIEKNSVEQFKIRVKDLPMGYYLVLITDNEKHYKKTYKFLKK